MKSAQKNKRNKQAIIDLAHSLTGLTFDYMQVNDLSLHPVSAFVVTNKCDFTCLCRNLMFSVGIILLSTVNTELTVTESRKYDTHTWVKLSDLLLT